jgi:hypothetical protein
MYGSGVPITVSNQDLIPLAAKISPFPIPTKTDSSGGMSNH